RPTLAAEYLNEKHDVEVSRETVRKWMPLSARTGIDDATSKNLSRFVRRDSTEENMGMLERYLKKYGRPVGCYTDRAGIFQTAVKTKRGEQRRGRTGRKCR